MIDEGSSLTSVIPQNICANIWYYKNIAKKIFNDFLNAYSVKNLELMKECIHPIYFQKTSTYIEKWLIWMTNVIKDIKLKNMDLIIYKINKIEWTNIFTMDVYADMINYTIQDKTWDIVKAKLIRWSQESDESYKQRVLVTPASIREYWTFIEVEKIWKLYYIEHASYMIRNINNFLLKKNFSYSKKLAK